METTCRYCRGVARRTREIWDGVYVWVCEGVGGLGGCKRRMIYNFQYKLVVISPSIKPRQEPSQASAAKTPGIQRVKEAEAAPQEQP